MTASVEKHVSTYTPRRQKNTHIPDDVRQVVAQEQLLQLRRRVPVNVEAVQYARLPISQRSLRINVVLNQRRTVRPCVSVMSRVP